MTTTWNEILKSKWHYIYRHMVTKQLPEKSSLLRHRVIPVDDFRHRATTCGLCKPDTGLMANPIASGLPACPLCGTEMLPEQQLSKDHVFGQALGGRVTVTTHKTCNNQSGSAAEGNLQRPHTIINLLKGVKGQGASPVPGSFPSGRRAELNLQDGSVYSPPIMRKSEDGTALSIEGTSAQAEKAYNTWRDRNPHINAPEFKDLHLALVTATSYDTINVELSYPLGDAEIVAVKSALGACALAYGPGFAASDFAATLRAVRDAPADPLRPVGDPAYLNRLDATIPIAAAQVGLSGTEVSALPRLAPAAGEIVHDVILIPVDHQQTLLFAHYASDLVPPYGIVIGDRLPPLTRGIQPTLPILLRDGGAGNYLEVTDFTWALLQPAINALPVNADDDIAQPGS